MHLRFQFNCLLNFNKVRTVRNINAFPYTSAKNENANRPHRSKIFADIARADLLLLNIKLIMNKPIKHLQIVWASIREKNIYQNGYFLSSNGRYLVLRSAIFEKFSLDI